MRNILNQTFQHYQQEQRKQLTYESGVISNYTRVYIRHHNMRNIRGLYTQVNKRLLSLSALTDASRTK